jgi:hypothetical protein
MAAAEHRPEIAANRAPTWAQIYGTNLGFEKTTAIILNRWLLQRAVHRSSDFYTMRFYRGSWDPAALGGRIKLLGIAFRKQKRPPLHGGLLF